MLSVSLINALIGLVVGVRSSASLLLPVALIEFAALASGVVATSSISVFTFALLASLWLQLGYCLAAYGPVLLPARLPAGISRSR